jgi:hypothetical protein
MGWRWGTPGFVGTGKKLAGKAGFGVQEPGFRETGRSIDPTAPPKLPGTGGYQSPDYQRMDPYSTPDYYQGGAADTLAMRQALGITDPADTRDATRTAVMGQLAAGEHASRATSDQTAANRGSGAYRSGAQQGALARIGAGYDQQRNMAEMGIQQDYANRKDAADRMAMEAAMGLQNNRNTFNVNNAQFGYGQAARDNAGANEAAINNAQFGYGALEKERDKSYEANKMAPWNARQNVLGMGTKALSRLTGLF